MAEATHSELIQDQFTRQAGVFNAAGTITNEQALKMIIEAGQAGSNDTVLDVACGGGIVVCAFAPHVSQATGIDMTPAMLDQSRKLAAQKQLTNVTWMKGDVTTLPFPDASFSIVTTRFSFHHFLDPSKVMKEMVRVCAPGGRIVVVDMFCSEDAAKAARWNLLEKLRDPSHVRCLSLSELKAMFSVVGLGAPKAAFYDLRDTVKALLGRSFPNAGDDVKITQMFSASVEDDSLGLDVEFRDGEIHYAYPTVILSAAKK
jgi:ubiquinone/menaquinone biosynthesis C-methylase UbiE